MAGKRIVDIILCRREAEPCVVHGEADLVWSLLEQLRVILHHALKSSRCLEKSSLGVRVFGVHEFWDNATTCLKRLDIVWDLEDKGVCVAGERGVTLFVRYVAFWVPFGFQERVELVILDIDDSLVAGFVLFDQFADGTHRLAGLSWYADRVHLPVIRAADAED